MSAQVAVFAATRADLFPLASVLAELAAADDLAPTLIASGTTGNRAFGDPLADLDLTGVRVDHVVDDLASADYASMTSGGARIAEAMAGVLQRGRFAALVVLGDRWELLYAVPPALLYGVPIVHLHGGELTEGAVDDRIRHAVTKLADLHCVSTERAAQRLRQLGEPGDRIFVTGAPSLDRMSAVKAASDERLQEILGREVVRPLILVTYHPATATGGDAGAGAADVLAAVAATAGTALVTHPGLDAGRDEVLAAIRAVAAESPNVVDVAALGADYLPVLAASDVVVGNSSSGLLEAASFGVPVVNVGDRQHGRERGANVIDVPEQRSAIEAAVRRCLSPEFRESARDAVNVYGDGKAAPRIVDVIRRAVVGGLARKGFVDEVAL